MGRLNCRTVLPTSVFSAFIVEYIQMQYLFAEKKIE